ncbi:MAG: hypothetical protein MSC43_03875 [Clostridiales bacterium]|nr:hypothetical protein [Clostridiales bacterium]MDD7432583.1 hypothetical protein [Clostridiales bacterium]MDY3062160.1 hypothetical protein [Eubacteriales bacterium]
MKFRRIQDERPFYKVLIIVALLALFILAFVLQIIGRANPGVSGLVQQMISLALLLALLATYNQRWR